MKPKARWSRWLAPLCLGGSFLALTVAACSVPEFEFPSGQGTAGDASVIPNDPCRNKRLDTDSGETDFDCGGACAPCGVGKHCMGAADCTADLLCHEGTCVGGGCTNQAKDGTETDADCGGDLCKPCITGLACVVPADCESGVCVDAKCMAPACNDQVKNGKETGLDCGGDCTPCPVDQPCVVGKDCISGECNTNVCAPECPDGFANCDKQNDNACEINTRTDLANCGFCGNVCNLPNATAECSAGECRIKTDGCAAGFQDCNGDPADGCEVDLKTNKLNCGACNKVCPALNGTPSCAAGACQITCTDGFDDCDDSRDNGCEINLHNDSKNCGVCDKKCAAAVGYSPFCKDSACGQTMCPAGKGDCNGDQADACEINLTNDVNNCGDCGHTCTANNANVACVNSQCVITSCKGKFADCDSATPDGFKTGCETDVNVSTSHCGGCGKACTISNGTPKCDLGVCGVSSCNGTFRDCDSDPKTGCEINVATNTKNCGGCGAMGSDCGSRYAHASSACLGSACAAPTCNAGFGDCVNGLTDGCESDTTTDANNCGACSTHCDPIHSSNTKCAASVCSSTCDAGWDKCKTPPQGCSTQLGTPQNCSKCGDACVTGGFCDAAVCADHRDIVVVNKGTNGVNGWDGGANLVAEIKLDHGLQTGKSNNRMLVVGIACTDNYTNPDNVVVTYAGTPMLVAIEQEDAGKHSYAGIYYLLDSALPDNPSTNQVVASFGPAFTWGHAGVDVLELKNTMQVTPIATGGTPGDANCGGSASRSGTVTFNQPGSLVYGVLSARGASSATLSSSSGLVESWNQLQPTPDKMVGAAAYVPDNDNRTITWSVANCYNSAVALAAIKRLSAN